MTQTLTQTPSQTVGPFFHDALIRSGQEVLVDAETQGRRIVLTGAVLDGDGAPIPDAMIEIWQADAQGVYKHPADPRHAQADRHFAGFGRSGTQSGAYRFLTVKPGAAGDDSAPHINVSVFARGMLIHAVTRVYFADEDNTADPALALVPAERRATLIAARIADAGGLPVYQLDIVMQGARETVFFDA